MYTYMILWGLVSGYVLYVGGGVLRLCRTAVPAPPHIRTPALWVERPGWQASEGTGESTPLETNVPILMLEGCLILRHGHSVSSPHSRIAEIRPNSPLPLSI